MSIFSLGTRAQGPELTHPKLHHAPVSQTRRRDFAIEIQQPGSDVGCYGLLKKTPTKVSELLRPLGVPLCEQPDGSGASKGNTGSAILKIGSLAKSISPVLRSMESQQTPSPTGTQKHRPAHLLIHSFANWALHRSSASLVVQHHLGAGKSSLGDDDGLRLAGESAR